MLGGFAFPTRRLHIAAHDDHRTEGICAGVFRGVRVVELSPAAHGTDTGPIAFMLKDGHTER